MENVSGISTLSWQAEGIEEKGNGGSERVGHEQTVGVR